MDTAEGTMPGLDSDQRPQKLVDICLAPDETPIQMCVRTMASDIGVACIPRIVKLEDQPASKPIACKAKLWPGWKRALDEELRAAGGLMPWKRLRTSLVARYAKACQNGKLCTDELGLLALAEIPEHYL